MFRLILPGSTEKFRQVTVLCKRNIALYSSLTSSLKWCIWQNTTLRLSCGRMESCQKSLMLVGKVTFGKTLFRLSYSFISDDCTSIIYHCFGIRYILN